MAVWPITCGNCGRGVSANVVAGWPQQKAGTRAPTPDAAKAAAASETLWLACPHCSEGSVKLKDGAVYPSAPAGAAVALLPADVAAAWREVRTAHAVAAYTAAEMMCRKILMHLAVDVAGAKPGKSFVEYVDALDGAGYVAPGLKPVVDLVRKRGNGANHELPASTEDDSMQTLGITEHLLKTIYELPGMAPAPSPVD